MALEMVRCSICRQQVQRNSAGQLLLHTKYMLDSIPPGKAEICPGSGYKARAK